MKKIILLVLSAFTGICCALSQNKYLPDMKFQPYISPPPANSRNINNTISKEPSEIFKTLNTLSYLNKNKEFVQATLKYDSNIYNIRTDSKPIFTINCNDIRYLELSRIGYLFSKEGICLIVIIQMDLKYLATTVKSFNTQEFKEIDKLKWLELSTGIYHTITIDNETNSFVVSQTDFND
jgi:hypothetical protein